MAWTIRKHELSYQIVEGDTIIATVHNVERSEDKRANANKMCASYDMYEALKKIIDSGVVYPGGGKDYAFEALAKAEGRSS